MPKCCLNLEESSKVLVAKILVTNVRYHKLFYSFFLLIIETILDTNNFLFYKIVSNLVNIMTNILYL